MSKYCFQCKIRYYEYDLQIEQLHDDDSLELKVIYEYLDIHAPSATYIYTTNYDGKQKILSVKRRLH